MEGGRVEWEGGQTACIDATRAKGLTTWPVYAAGSSMNMQNTDCWLWKPFDGRTGMRDPRVGVLFSDCMGDVDVLILELRGRG